MIKISNFAKEGNVVTFEVSKIDIKMLNALRRTIISMIPVMAMEKVTFYNNSSILNDEMLAHRIGLVPLTTDLKTYVHSNECSCEGKGCARCMCMLSLDVTGPKTVYSGDLKSLDENVRPVFDKMPLVKLGMNQKIKLEAEAVMGLGRDHAKWHSGVASYEAVEKDKGTFQVRIESFGQLPVEELITTAFDLMDVKIGQLKEKLG